MALSGDGRYAAVAVAWPEIDPRNELATTQLDISDDGRFLALASVANLAQASLAPCTHFPDQELSFCRHVYLIDRETTGVELISVSGSGEPANGVSLRAAISGDGRFVLFDSFANNLTGDPVCPEPFTHCSQVYLRDRAEGRTILLSRGTDGETANDGSFAAALSADGAVAAIISGATNLSASATPDPFYTRKGFLADVNAILGHDSR